MEISTARDIAIKEAFADADGEVRPSDYIRAGQVWDDAIQYITEELGEEFADEIFNQFAVALAEGP